jgi:gluconokinase
LIVVLWGVSGCGKSTVGALLAESLSCPFYDADDFHPPANIEKMRAAIPLTDDDRWPWLQRLADMLQDVVRKRGSAVLACSALKQSYRNVLSVDDEQVVFVQLAGSFDLIEKRMASRRHEFMNNDLLRSQFDTLEPAADGLVEDINAPPGQICTRIMARLGLS